MPTLPKETAAKVIATNVGCIKTLLENALVTVIEADAAVDQNEMNLAIGCLLDIEPLLANAKALYDTTIFFHRNAK